MRYVVAMSPFVVRKNDFTDGTKVPDVDAIGGEVGASFWQLRPEVRTPL